MAKKNVIQIKKTHFDIIISVFEIGYINLFMMLRHFTQIIYFSVCVCVWYSVWFVLLLSPSLPQPYRLTVKAFRLQNEHKHIYLWLLGVYMFGLKIFSYCLNVCVWVCDVTLWECGCAFKTFLCCCWGDIH